MSGCQLRVGDDHRGLAIYCGIECLKDSSYCSEHHARIWTKDRSPLKNTTSLGSWTQRRDQRLAVVYRENETA